MMSKLITIIFLVISLKLQPLTAQTWIRGGYYRGDWASISDINSSLFTHLIWGYAVLNHSSYELSASPQFSAFTWTVKKKNPSVITLLSIWAHPDYTIFSSMASNPSYRKSFIHSSIEVARRYGFQGLDFWWGTTEINSTDMFNMDTLFKEWRAAIRAEPRNSTQSELILTAVVTQTPNSTDGKYPVDSIQQNLDWVHVHDCDLSLFGIYKTNHTAAPKALFNPTGVSEYNTDYGIRAWIDAGLPAKKIVLLLPYFGYAWKLVNSEENGIGAAATGPFLTEGGTIFYREIKSRIERTEASCKYNESYVVNYCTINGATWISFDDVETVQRKVSYAKENGLLGSYSWPLNADDEDWVLSKAAAQVDVDNIPSQNDKNRINKGLYRLLVIILPTTAVAFLLIGFVIYWNRKRKLKIKESNSLLSNAVDAGDFYRNSPTLIPYSLADIKAATDNFSIENKLGQGGYGPVYKGVLSNGQIIAVKKLSDASTQGLEEFKNEVMLTAKLQHVNLIKLLGFYIDRKEQMLIYEYMPNKSLDRYLFDPIRRYTLDWDKRIHIIDGICQGLLYLQNYSRLTIIHRDLKASNILLDEQWKPKISDFGMARIFTKDGLEVNTQRIVGTYGYAPPEYVKRGIYSTKSDVYSFGVLLLQIISGKRVSILYGEHEQFSLLEYAYELWNAGKSMEFMDSSLDDTYSPYKLIRYLQIALLCVQEIPTDRPSVVEISFMLKSESMVIMIPGKPAFSKQTDRDVPYESTTSNLEICSINDTTISDLEAR